MYTQNVCSTASIQSLVYIHTNWVKTARLLFYILKYIHLHTSVLVNSCVAWAYTHQLRHNSEAYVLCGRIQKIRLYAHFSQLQYNNVLYTHTNLSHNCPRIYIKYDYMHTFWSFKTIMCCIHTLIWVTTARNLSCVLEYTKNTYAYMHIPVLLQYKICCIQTWNYMHINSQSHDNWGLRSGF
jgi:hypothetical protein